MDNTLTAKEQIVLELVQQGLTNSKIAVQGEIHPTKVASYIRSIKSKIGVNSKEEMIALKRERRIEAMNNTGEAEKIQHALYLDIKRNWYHGTSRDDMPFYASKVFFLKDGRIGMEYGGRVIVRSIEHWMAQKREESCSE